MSLSRRARTYASILSVLALFCIIHLFFSGLASTMGTPASSKASTFFCHRLPVASQAALHSPYFAFRLLAHSSADA